jgi:hypothetical protein
MLASAPLLAMAWRRVILPFQAVGDLRSNMVLSLLRAGEPETRIGYEVDRHHLIPGATTLRIAHRPGCFPSYS